MTDNSPEHKGIVATLLLCLLIGLLWYQVPHPIVPVVLALVPFALMGVLALPIWVGIWFIAFSFFRLHEVFAPLYNFKIPLMLALGSLTTLAWHGFITNKIKPYTTKEMNVFFGFFLLITVGVIFAGNRPEAIAYWKDTYLKIGIMTPALAWLLRKPADFRLALRILTCCGLAVGIVALYNKTSGIGLVEGTRVTIGRDLGSVLGDPNDLALVLMFPFSFAMALSFGPKISRGDRLLGIIAALILIFAIIATQSRGGLLGMLTVMALFAWPRFQSKAALVGMGLVAMVVLYFAAGIGGRKSGGAAESGVDESAMGRLYAWEAAWGMAVDNPVTGVGLNNFYFNYFFYSPHWDGLNHAVHSTWFGVLAESGFVGISVFCAMIFFAIKSARSSLLHLQASDHASPTLLTISEGILAGLWSFCVSGTFLTQGFTWPIYILVALSAAVAHHLLSDAARNSHPPP